MILKLLAEKDEFLMVRQSRRNLRLIRTRRYNDVVTVGIEAVVPLLSLDLHLQSEIGELWNHAPEQAASCMNDPLSNRT